MKNPILLTHSSQCTTTHYHVNKFYFPSGVQPDKKIRQLLKSIDDIQQTWIKYFAGDTSINESLQAIRNEITHPLEQDQSQYVLLITHVGRSLNNIAEQLKHNKGLPKAAIQAALTQLLPAHSDKNKYTYKGISQCQQWLSDFQIIAAHKHPFPGALANTQGFPLTDMVKWFDKQHPSPKKIATVKPLPQQNTHTQTTNSHNKGANAPSTPSPKWQIKMTHQEDVKNEFTQYVAELSAEERDKLSAKSLKQEARRLDVLELRVNTTKSLHETSTTHSARRSKATYHQKAHHHTPISKKVQTQDSTAMVKSRSLSKTSQKVDTIDNIMVHIRGFADILFPHCPQISDRLDRLTTILVTTKNKGGKNSTSFSAIQQQFMEIQPYLGDATLSCPHSTYHAFFAHLLPEYYDDLDDIHTGIQTACSILKRQKVAASFSDLSPSQMAISLGKHQIAQILTPQPSNICQKMLHRCTIL